MPLRDGCARINDNFRVGDEIGNAHTDLRKEVQRSLQRQELHFLQRMNLQERIDQMRLWRAASMAKATPRRADARHSEAVGQEIASIPRLLGSCRVWGDPPLPLPESHRSWIMRPSAR